MELGAFHCVKQNRNGWKRHCKDSWNPRPSFLFHFEMKGNTEETIFHESVLCVNVAMYFTDVKFAQVYWAYNNRHCNETNVFCYKMFIAIISEKSVVKGYICHLPRFTLLLSIMLLGIRDTHCTLLDTTMIYFYYSLSLLINL